MVIVYEHFDNFSSSYNVITLCKLSGVLSPVGASVVTLLLLTPSASFYHVRLCIAVNPASLPQLLGTGYVSRNILSELDCIHS